MSLMIDGEQNKDRVPVYVIRKTLFHNISLTDSFLAWKAETLVHDATFQ